MDQSLRRFQGTWGGLSPVRKGLLTAAGLGLVALMFFLYTWSTSVGYVPLYSGLAAADSGEIVEQLQADGVPYEIDAGGATVKVPQDRVDELRLQFAAQGLPEGGHVGFEVFEGNAFTATDFVQRLNFQRGLQGELARTIESFPAVDKARVHLVLPERSLFLEDQSPATASVVLSMQPGSGLNAEEVASVAHLVSGAVEGLEKSAITILDDQGTLLYDGATAAEGGGFGATASQLEMQQAYEAELESSVQQMLDRTLGPGAAVVSVRAVLDFNRRETQSETFAQPEDGGVPRSTTTLDERYTTSADGLAGAAPGAVPNVPGANADLPGGEGDTTGVIGATDGATTDYARTEETTNFEVGRTTEHTVVAPGSVERLSVSLLLDESVPEAQVAALQDSVAAAAGVNPDRGDQIVVNRIPFDTTVADEAAAAFEAQASSEQLLNYVRLGLPIAVIVIGFIFFRLLMRSVDRRGSYQVVETYEEDEALQAIAAANGPRTLAAAGAGAGGGMRGLPGPDEIKKSDLEVQVSRLASSHPETVAEVVQAWLRED